MKLEKKLSSEKLVFIIFVALVLLRLLYSSGLYLNFKLNSPHDDMLQFVKAASIADGSWLGEYNNLTLVKGCGYPLFLALIIKLRLNYMFCLELVYVLACVLAVTAIKPILKYRYSSLVTFVFLSFAPIAATSEVLRLYRDAVYFSFAFICVSCVIGFVVRYKQSGFRRYLFAVGAGLSFVFTYNTREDSQWLLLFLAAATVVYVILVLTDKQVKSKAVKSVLFPSITAVCYLLVALPICLLNYSHYGVFTLDEYNSGAFRDAYSALNRPYSENFHQYIPLSEDVRIKLYDLSPSFAKLEPYLEGDGAATAWKSINDDYQYGYLSYALRDAAAYAGYYESALKAEAFWRSVATEVNAACDSRQIDARKGISLGLASPLPSSYYGEVLKDTYMTVKATLLCACSEPFMEYDSILEMDLSSAQKYENTLNCKIFYTYREDGKLIASYDKDSFYFQAVFFVAKLYSFISPVLFIGALALNLCFIVCLPSLIKNRSRDGNYYTKLLSIILSWGLLLTFIVRCAMIGYVNTIGTTGAWAKPSYIATGYPLLYLSICVSFVCAFHLFKDKLFSRLTAKSNTEAKSTEA